MITFEIFDTFEIFLVQIYLVYNNCKINYFNFQNRQEPSWEFGKLPCENLNYLYFIIKQITLLNSKANFPAINSTFTNTII